MVQSGTIRPIAENTRDFSGSASATAQLIIPYNINRKHVTIENRDGANAISISRGNPNVTLTSGIPLNANGGSYEIDQTNMYKGDIYLIGSAAAEAFTAEEVSG